MKKIFYLTVLPALLTAPAMAEYSDEQFQSEVLEGLDLISVRENIDMPEPAKGELGLDVYQTTDAGYNPDIKLYIPTSLPDESFVRMISEYQKDSGEILPLNSLLILNVLPLLFSMLA